ncbi:MAG TPA: polysaccharide deacetylase family protein [Pyrinomonadaceae bacterium]|nr:polysaccharide deacetylase family protein [Pyrinomonadaceae bacterium]
MKPKPLVTIFAATIICLSQFIPGKAILTKQAPQARTLAERLGYPRDAKLLIVHADDLGMAHSVNAATIKAFESGLVSSGSIMVPCPWFAEIANYARKHPQADLGLHLTLTSEWIPYKWGPVLPPDRVASLLDKSGYLYLTEAEAAKHANVKEVEAEIRAQIERARAFGIQPTHLDSHMGTLYQNRALFETFLKVSRDNRLLLRVSKEMFSTMEFLSAVIGPNEVVIDRIVSIGPDVAPEDWARYYTDAVKSIQPGVTEIIVHIAYDDAEMRAATVDHPDWGAAWRQRDFDFFTSEAFRKLLQENNIQLITWRQIGKLVYPPQ